MNATATLGAPVSPWMIETGSFVLWSVLAAATLLIVVKNRRMPLIGFCLIAASTSSWQEFFGDWGAYVAWNPWFIRVPFWGDTPFTTPVKPLLVFFSWGWWFAATIPLLVSLVAWLRGRGRKRSATLLSFLTAFPLFLAYQLYAEGSSVSNGWWTYDVVIGPSIVGAYGQLPIIFPVLLAFWVAGFVALLSLRDAQGLWWHDYKFGVTTMKPGARRELMRVLVFVLLFQVSFFAINIGPAMIGRALFGGPSQLVP